MSGYMVSFMLVPDWVHAHATWDKNAKHMYFKTQSQKEIRYVYIFLSMNRIWIRQDPHPRITLTRTMIKKK